MHKQERFDRDHVRSHKASRDQTFTIDPDSQAEKEAGKVEKKDAVIFTGHAEVQHVVHDQPDDTSDSDDDWADY